MARLDLRYAVSPALGAHGGLSQVRILVTPPDGKRSRPPALRPRRTAQRAACGQGARHRGHARRVLAPHEARPARPCLPLTRPLPAAPSPGLGALAGPVHPPGAASWSAERRCLHVAHAPLLPTAQPLRLTAAFAPGGQAQPHQTASLAPGLMRPLVAQFAAAGCTASGVDVLVGGAAEPHGWWPAATLASGSPDAAVPGCVSRVLRRIVSGAYEVHAPDEAGAGQQARQQQAQPAVRAQRPAGADGAVPAHSVASGGGRQMPASDFEDLT